MQKEKNSENWDLILYWANNSMHKKIPNDSEGRLRVGTVWRREGHSCPSCYILVHTVAGFWLTSVQSYHTFCPLFLSTPYIPHPCPLTPPITCVSNLVYSFCICLCIHLSCTRTHLGHIQFGKVIQVCFLKIGLWCMHFSAPHCCKWI